MFRLLSKPSAKLFSKLIVLFYLFTSIICGFWFFQMLANSIPRSLNPCLFQSLSCVQLFVTPWTAAGRAALQPSNHLILSTSSPPALSLYYRKIYYRKMNCNAEIFLKKYFYTRNKPKMKLTVLFTVSSKRIEKLQIGF